MEAHAMDLLTLVVALSAYLATLRLFGFDRLSGARERRKKKCKCPCSGEVVGDEEAAHAEGSAKELLFSATIADIPLVVAGVLLTFGIFGKDLGWFCSEFSACLIRFGVLLFLLAAIILAVLHVITWSRARKSVSDIVDKDIHFSRMLAGYCVAGVTAIYFILSVFAGLFTLVISPLHVYASS